MSNKARIRRRIWAFLALIVVAGIALAFVLGKPKTRVEVARVARGTFERWVEEDGRARVRNRFVVSTPIAGTVERTSHRVGDWVAKGEVVATLRSLPGPMIDPRSRAELEQRRGAAEAALASARAAVDRAVVASAHADAELARTRVLVEGGGRPEQDLREADLAARVAARERDQARYAAHLAEHNLEMARAALGSTARGGAEQFPIDAPEAGRILRVFQESEGAVPVGAPLFEIGDPTALELVVDLLSTDAILVKPGGEARLTHWAGSEELAGRVRLVEPIASTKVSALGVEEQRVNVIVDPASESEAWKRVGDGYRVDARLLVERIEGAVLVPTSALFRERGDWAAFVAEDGRARLRTVHLRAYGPVQSAVEAGLVENDAVVVQPPQDLIDGRAIEAEAAAR